MPENLDFTLYFNIVFFSLVVLGFIFGYLRGFRKSLYSLIVMAIFYVFFFVTIDVVVSRLWVIEVPQLFAQISPYVPEVAGANSFEEAITAFLESVLPEDMSTAMSNERFMAFIFGLGQFVLKIVYTIVYFTVFQLIYRIIMFFIRILFFRAKAKGLGKARLPGAFVGAGKGVMSAFVTLIVLGGMMSVMESFLALIPEEEGTNGGNVTASVEDAYYVYGAYGVELDTALPAEGEQEEALLMASEMVDAYNNNLFVRGASTLKFEMDGYPNEVSLHMYLFDSVMSFDYQDEKVKLRKELVIYADIGRIFLMSEYATSRDLSDVTGDDVREAFRALSNSELFTSLLPLGIELGSEYYDKEIDLDIDELYAIDWQNEVMQLGEVAAVGFDLISSAGLLEENPSLETITLSGDDVEGLFDELADSELVTLAAYVALEPVLEGMSAQIQSVITVPEGLVWADEFRAFGSVAGAILNTGITVSDLQSGDPSVILGSLSSLDLTVLLDSKIVSQALINVFSKEATIDGLDMITVPTNVVWEDTYDGDIRTDGELRNILNAVNAIMSVASNFDFDNLTIQVIADFDDPTIDAIFDSRVLVASISTFMLDMSLGDVSLIIPDDALGTEGYILKTELSSLATSARVLVGEMACDDGDTVCESRGFDVGKAFNLEEEVIDTLLSSIILSSTIGNLVIENGQDILTIPSGALTSIMVDGVSMSVVSDAEIKQMFMAIGVFGFEDINNITFDPAIIQSLSVDGDPLTLDTAKSQELFDSMILHATLSTIMIEQTEGLDSILVVPYYDEDSNVVRTYDAVDDIDYIEISELNAILQGLISLDITTFEDVNTLNVDSVLSKLNILLDSAILHATLSKQALDLGEGVLSVPEADEDSNLVRITVGSGLQATEYISKAEINALVGALEALGISSVTAYDGNFDLTALSDETAQDTVLESASIHLTISNLLLDLGDDVLIVPMYKEAGETPGNEVRKTVGTTEYVVKEEIKALINAFDAMNFLDLDSFGTSLDSSQFFTQREVLLGSASIQATLSDKLLNDTAGALLVPDVNVNTGDPIRIVQSDVTYVELSEIYAIMDALEEFGLTDFATLDFNPATVFSADFSIVLASASLQATISDNILATATDESSPGSAVLIVPSTYRENILIDGVSEEQIEQTELNALLDSLSVLGISTFSGDVSSSSATTMSDTEIDTMLASASMHVTISQMLKDAFGTSVPDLAKETTYGIAQVVIAQEVKDFMKATQAFGGGDFTTVSFDIGGILSLSLSEQDTVLSSMTVRNILTPALETTALLNGYSITNSDYMNSDPATFLTKTAAIAIINN
ncbi:MAG: hypothetical protein ACVCEJ_00035 [Candidatus Izemoplasmataceae bacterium]